MADDLPVELKIRTLTLKPSTDEDEQTLRATQEAAVHSCAFAAVQEGLDEESAVIKFRRQLRESRWERYRQGIRSIGCNCARATQLWEAGYGGAEQALWVAAQEDKMVEQYSQIVRLAGVQSTEDSVQERSAPQPGIQPQETAEDSVPPPSIQPRKTAAPNRKREEDRAPQTSVQPEESAAPNRQREEMGALRPSIQPEESAAPNRRREERMALQGAPGATSQGTEGTQDFWTNFVTSLDAMEVTMASEQTKASGEGAEAVQQKAAGSAWRWKKTAKRPATNWLRRRVFVWRSSVLPAPRCQPPCNTFAP